MTAGDRSRPSAREFVGRRVGPGVGAGGDFTYCVIEPFGAKLPAGAPPGDRRGDLRIPSHLREALVRENRGRPIVDCRIRDLSRKGARLQLDRARPLPRTFMIREAGTHRSFLATLVWQVGRDAGVKLMPVDDPRT